jgi:hypothetical protein
MPDLAVQLGLPSLEPSEEPACILTVNSGLTCSRNEFFASLNVRQPTQCPNTTPGYGSTAFVVLGYAIESITGKSFKEVMQSLSDALMLDGTSVDTPDVSRGAILKNMPSSGFQRETGGFMPAGGIYSSLNDLSQIGRSILGSTLLNPNTTRAWLKPTSYTSDLRSALGRPWEIYRVDTKSSRGVIDIFAKGGDFGLYHTKIGLVPDYNIGFVSFLGGPGEKDWLGDQIVDIILPALEEAARDEADAKYAGTYTAVINGTGHTLILSTEARKPGLGINKWTRNGSDILKVLSQVAGEILDTDNFRLLPTNIGRNLEGGASEISWRTLVSSSQPNDVRSVFGACDAWFAPESTAYGHHTIDQMLFTMDSEGKATKVSPRAWKVDLEREV